MTHSPSDLTDQLTRSLGEEPPAPPLDDTLRAARGALARRRITVAGSVVAVVAVVGGASALLGSSGTRQVAPADSPASTAAPSPDLPHSTPPPTYTGPRPANGSDVELTAQGELLTAPGVTVVRRVENPLGYPGTDHSLGVVYRTDGATTWALLTNVKEPRGRSASVSSDPARKAFATYDGWLADQVALHNGEATTDASLVDFAPDGTLVPAPGVEILVQTSDVDLGPSFAAPGDPVAAALVRRDGDRVYVLARQVGGSPTENITTDVSVGGPNLADFLDYARQQYAGGEGLR